LLKERKRKKNLLVVKVGKEEVMLVEPKEDSKKEREGM
jgi:hypothetical protein